MSQKELHNLGCKRMCQPEICRFLWVRQRIISTPSKTARRFLPCSPSSTSANIWEEKAKEAGVTPQEFFDEGNACPVRLRELMDEAKRLDDNALGHLLALMRELNAGR